MTIPRPLAYWLLLLVAVALAAFAGTQLFAAAPSELIRSIREGSAAARDWNVQLLAVGLYAAATAALLLGLAAVLDLMLDIRAICLNLGTDPSTGATSTAVSVAADLEATTPHPPLLPGELPRAWKEAVRE